MYLSLIISHLITLSVFSHHMWVSGLLEVGSAAHITVYLLTRPQILGKSKPIPHSSMPIRASKFIKSVLSHRDILLGHLVWADLCLGSHTFGVYLHNDTQQSLGRPETSFSDIAIPLKPILSSL